MQEQPAPKATAQDRGQGRSYFLALLCGAGVFCFVDRQILTILLDPVQRDLGVSDTAMGLLTGLGFTLFYLTAGVPLALWADRANRRNLIAACLGVWSFMTMLCGLAQSFFQLAAARAGVAVGEAGANPASHALIMDLYPPGQRATALAVLNASQSLGIAAGLALGGWLSTIIGWRGAFLVVGAPGLLWALLVRFSVREPPRGRWDGKAVAGGSLLMAFARLWRLKTMRLILLLAAIGAFNGYSILTWSPTFFIRAHGFTPGELGVRIAAATATGLIIGNLLAGWLADRLSASDPRWYMRVAGMGSLLAAPFVLAFLFLRDATWSLVALGSAQCLLTAFTVPTLTMALSLAPPQMRATTSMTLGMTMNLIGAGLGPLVVGVLNDALRAEYGPEAIRYSLCVVVVGLLACGGLAFRVNRWVADDLGLDARTADSN